YHIASVWRGENTQRGRYREFMQCDFDTIGTESVVSDVETILVIHDLLRAIGIERFTIRINDRNYLASILEVFGFTERKTELLRVLDKKDKVGVDGVLAELAGLGFDVESLRACLRYMDGQDVRPDLDGAMARLVEVREAVLAAGVEAARIAFDRWIARGLDYYT